MTPVPPYRAEVEFDVHATGLSEFEAEVDRAIQSHGYEEAVAFAVRLAIEEAVANGIHHGNRRAAGKVVKVQCRVDDREIFIAVEDEGEGFDPSSVPDPTDEANLSIPSGRGLMLMGAYMSEVRHIPPGNRVEMTYRRPAS